MEKQTKSFATGEVPRNWVLVDVAGVPLGRAASRIAEILRGKHKPQFTPHSDVGDFVVVINAEKVGLTGRKQEKKLYRWHSGYLGHLKERTAKEMLNKDPAYLIRHAVKGMLPKNRLGRKLLKKLKVYAGPEHPHQAQRPQKIDVTKKLGG